MERTRWGALAVLAAGTGALLARPWLVRLPFEPVALLAILFVSVGVAGAAWRLPADRLPAHRLSPATADRLPPPTADRLLPAWLVLGFGLGAFGIGRLLAVGTAPVAPLVARSVALTVLAGVAEEAFFRRLAYGVAESRGPVVAVVSSATVFAAVHVTVWGWAVLPLDMAAGLLLGWQRWASGRWSVPAATHATANVWTLV